MKKYFGLICVLCLLAGLSACASPRGLVAEPQKRFADKPNTSSAVGDVVLTSSGAAEIKTVYVSALGHPCRRLALMENQERGITECYDGEWYPVNDIAGINPARN